MNADELRICDACEESFTRAAVHYCSCGALLCYDCYAEEGHNEHDEEPPYIAAIPSNSDAYRGAKLSAATR